MLLPKSDCEIASKIPKDKHLLSAKKNDRAQSNRLNCESLRFEQQVFVFNQETEHSRRAIDFCRTC